VGIGLPAELWLPPPFRQLKSLQYLRPVVCLQEWMDELLRITGMTEQDRQISEIIAQERSRLRSDGGGKGKWNVERAFRMGASILRLLRV
jgi:hypothetical protein